MRKPQKWGVFEAYMAEALLVVREERATEEAAKAAVRVARMEATLAAQEARLPLAGIQASLDAQAACKAALAEMEAAKAVPASAGAAKATLAAVAARQSRPVDEETAGLRKEAYLRGDERKLATVTTASLVAAGVLAPPKAAKAAAPPRQRWEHRAAMPEVTAPAVVTTRSRKAAPVVLVAILAMATAETCPAGLMGGCIAPSVRKGNKITKLGSMIKGSRIRPVDLEECSQSVTGNWCQVTGTINYTGSWSQKLQFPVLSLRERRKLADAPTRERMGEVVDLLKAIHEEQELVSSVVDKATDRRAALRGLVASIEALAGWRECLAKAILSFEDSEFRVMGLGGYKMISSRVNWALKRASRPAARMSWMYEKGAVTNLGEVLGLAA